MAAATAAVRSYYAVTDRLFSDPQASIDDAATVAGGTELEEIRSQVQAQRVQQLHQTGSVVMASVTATAVTLAAPTSVALTACMDVSGVDVVDADGQSQVAADRAPRSIVDLTVVDRGSRGWLVEQTESHGEACAG